MRLYLEKTGNESHRGYPYTALWRKSRKLLGQSDIPSQATLRHQGIMHDAVSVGQVELRCVASIELVGLGTCINTTSKDLYFTKYHYVVFFIQPPVTKRLWIPGSRTRLTEGRRRGAIFRRTCPDLSRIRRRLKTKPPATQALDRQKTSATRTRGDKYTTPSTVPNVEDAFLPRNCQTSAPLLSSVMCMFP